MATGPTLLPAADKGLSLPVPATTAGTPGVTSPGPGGALDLTTEVLGPPDKESPPEHGHIPLDRTWHPPAVLGQPPTSVAPGSSTVVQSRVPGSPHVPLSSQPAPTGGSAVPTLPTSQPSPGTRWGILGLSPTAGTLPGSPSPRVWLPHTGSGRDPTETPHILGGTPVGVGNAGSWAATAQPSWQRGSLPSPLASKPPQQSALSQPASSLETTTATGVTNTAVTAATTITAATTSPALLRDMGTITPEPGAAVLKSDEAGLAWGTPNHLPTMMLGPSEKATDPPGTLGHREGPGSPPAATGTDPVQPSSSPSRWPDADIPQVTPATAGKAPRVFIVEDQPPLLRGGSGGLGPSAGAQREEEMPQEP
ncbi:collagen alpha-1 chain-like [Limosa lapponica baueri]|uniref:Collagen alpha-1 chain-like n=1 Tax=Limosa lapponica baueri TaxID=1758121 RepID=A0A2I0T4E3_LIMLA|nr:collagen alpha-1 chain-like [Limosa lapponica baueri]